MKPNFNYIRNRISDYKKDDLLEHCYNVLDGAQEEKIQVWFIFILMKWTLIYGEKKYPTKKLTLEKFNKLFNEISNFNSEHISRFLRDKQIDKAFQIFYSQQFYLQKTVYKEIFATQLKLFSRIKGKYDIEKSFKEKTGFTILDFLFIEQIIWLYINIKEIKNPNLYFEGILEDHFLKLVEQITSADKVKCFINLLTLNPANATESISKFKHKIQKEDLQTMEMSFFTMFPFSIYKEQIKLIHSSVFKYSINYYIYDFLKTNDPDFTTEFGYRLEKYIELGILEMKIKFSNELQLKKILPAKSNLTDFFLEEENIFIESKATELQAYTSVNPTDERLYNSLKSSLFKAYFEQLVPVSRILRPDTENWGIIITYKELFWSDFSKLFEIGKDKYPSNQSFKHLPPENVFIIDIYTWDKIVQIIKGNAVTLLEILRTVKLNNSKPETSRQLFEMHLDKYAIGRMNLLYLQQEIKDLDIKE